MLNDLSKNKTDNIDTTEKRELFKNIENKVQKKNTSYDEIKKALRKKQESENKVVFTLMKI
ncbi:hypothetical protein [Lactococcus fujiensis]|uniref:hypothetical protein n=1 Tax=Lactococcus fujiensis TaxID=610251 RepID=UPI0006CF5300|nr:hypothetical protein [Lactococcus fujiensis]